MVDVVGLELTVGELTLSMTWAASIAIWPVTVAVVPAVACSNRTGALDWPRRRYLRS